MGVYLQCFCPCTTFFAAVFLVVKVLAPPFFTVVMISLFFTLALFLFFCVCVSKLLPSRFGEFCIVEISREFLPFANFYFQFVAIIKEKKWNYGPIFLNIEKIYHIK